MVYEYIHNTYEVSEPAATAVAAARDDTRHAEAEQMPNTSRCTGVPCWGACILQCAAFVLCQQQMPSMSSSPPAPPEATSTESNA